MQTIIGFGQQFLHSEELTDMCFLIISKKDLAKRRRKLESKIKRDNLKVLKEIDSQKGKNGR